jgi:hypothetical protein
MLIWMEITNLIYILLNNVLHKAMVQIHFITKVVQSSTYFDIYMLK